MSRRGGLRLAPNRFHSSKTVFVSLRIQVGVDLGVGRAVIPGGDTLGVVMIAPAKPDDSDTPNE